MNIILIGFKNCGKTSVGKLLSTMIHYYFIDTDHLIEKNYQQIAQEFLTFSEIFQFRGEKFFRALETETIASLGDRKDTVIATGGGSMLVEENISHLKKQGSLLYLNASFNLLRKRIKTMPTFIDSSMPVHSLKKHFTKRALIYRKNADFEIQVDNKSIVSLANEITALMEIQHGQ